MIVAELHGKVSSSVRNHEDILTSHVFGTLELMDSERLLLPWLRKAAQPREGGQVPLFLRDVVRVEMGFWPTLLVPSVPRTVEPDVLLTLTDTAGTVTLLVVEAKFRSGPSGWPAPPTEAEMAELQGQLGRQWRALKHLPLQEAPGRPTEVHRFVLIYLTAHIVCPTDELNAMIEELNPPERAAFRDGLYWLSWRDLYLVLQSLVLRSHDNVLDPPEQRWSDQRLQRVLEQRLLALLEGRSLATFGGCRAPRNLQIPWHYGPLGPSGRH